MSKKVVISGAGLVGSLLAVTLKRRGFDVHLHEKRDDFRNKELEAGKSINLIITAKGIKALDNVGLKERILASTVPVYGRMMHDLKGNQTYQPYGKDESECNYSVSRALLNKEMVRIADEEGVKLYFDDGLESMELDKKTASFKKSGDVSYDLFFGTDGAGSPCRKAITAATPGATDMVQPLGADYKELYMPAKADGTYAIDKKCLHIWPRGSHMLMALPNLDGSFTMTLYLPTEDFKSLKSEEDVRRHFEKEYPDSTGLMPGYEKEFLENPQGFLGTLRASHWVYEDSVALLGDAAHAVVPFFGQGMNAGFEDITWLTKMMDEHGNDWKSVMDGYFKQQFQSGNAIADMAIENFTVMKDKVGDEKFLLRKKVEHRIENTFPELYRSRYALVVYTLTPYHICQKAGVIQDEILDELCQYLDSVEQLDLDRARALIEEKLTPFRVKHSMA